MIRNANQDKTIMQTSNPSCIMWTTDLKLNINNISDHQAVTSGHLISVFFYSLAHIVFHSCPSSKSSFIFMVSYQWCRRRTEVIPDLKPKDPAERSGSYYTKTQEQSEPALCVWLHSNWGEKTLNLFPLTVPAVTWVDPSPEQRRGYQRSFSGPSELTLFKQTTQITQASSAHAYSINTHRFETWPHVVSSVKVFSLKALTSHSQTDLRFMVTYTRASTWAFKYSSW